MSGFFKISEAASLGLHAMTYLVAHPDENVSTASIAGVLSVSEHHLAKVMQRLSRGGLVASNRGPGGGFRLAKDAADVTLLDIFEAIEGKVEARTCLLGDHPICPPGKCIFGRLNTELHDQVKKHFQQTRLADTADVFGG
jgi:Rrf2 family transcriptional regulator, nitric oxide-sensitive transcriptional repressor